MRFARLRENSANYVSVNQSSSNRLILVAYNAVFWIFLLPFITTMEYSTGFIAFTVIIFVRLAANLYINAFKLKPEQYESFPLRTP